MARPDLRSLLLLLVPVVAIAILPSPATAQNADGPAELRVLVSPGFAAAYDALIPEFERAHNVRILTGRGGSTGRGAGAIPGRVLNGDTVDVVIVAVEGIEELLASGGIFSSSRVDLASTGVGMAVPAGRPKPDISTPAALRQTLLAARSVAYSRGPSGSHIANVVLKRLEIADEVAAKAVIQTDVPGALIGGRAEIGFQQVSELVPADGVDFVAPLPAELQLRTDYAAAIAVQSERPQLAAELIAFLAGDAADSAIERTGLSRPTELEQQR